MPQMGFYNRNEFVRSLGGLAKTEVGYAVDLKWIRDTADRLLQTKKTHMIFIVKEQDEKGNIGYIIPPLQYRLFIDGLDPAGSPAMAEDFPPAVWPE